MKSFGQVLLFFLCFSIEVRVKASASPTLFQSPHKIFSLKTAELVIRGQKGLVLEKLDPKYFKYIDGNIWFKTTTSLRVKTVFGDVSSRGAGEFWILKDDRGVRVRNVTAQVDLYFRDGKKLELPEGFEVWLGGLDERGQTTFGMIEPIDQKNHIRMWASLYKGDAKLFKKEVVQFRERQQDIQIYAAELYRGVARRHIASVEESAKQEKERQERIQKQKKEFRQFIINRTFGR